MTTFDMGFFKQFKLNILILFLSEITAVWLNCVKNFNVDMQLDVYESIWFKLGMMIDTIKLSILILV